MADSPPRPDLPGPPPGDDLEVTQIAEDHGPRVTVVPEPGGSAGVAPAPWGGSPPWWSSAGSGTPPAGVAPVQEGRPGLPDATVSNFGPGPARLASALKEVQGSDTGGMRALEMPQPLGPSAIAPPSNGQHQNGYQNGQHQNGQARHQDVLAAGGQSVVAVQALPSWESPGPPGLRDTGAPGSRQARKPVPGIVLGIIAGTALAVILLVAVIAFRSGGDGGGDKGAEKTALKPKRLVAAAPAAGGLLKDAADPVASAAYPFIAAAVRAGGVPAPGAATAMYTSRPEGLETVLFMGGTGQVGDPAAFLKKARPSTFITAEGAEPGKGGGRAMCGTFAVLADVHLYCAWATRDSFGIVASDEPASSPDTGAMADLMRRMRPELERHK
ncbi:hypothetical protein [Actinomadura xylanilytica]|uniref:hypothetical protein n=1 Tax=Actinomadura xylanilytica TaxID=887459 RepID=UPI00255AD152|nr:hypothetical protein [Actinomadura xylanilytica]MDL4777767.1 hypothetical protein [Actinomadura xylanilytica]